MAKTKKSNVRVADVIGLMERIAPPMLAEEWDNCGLQLGSPQWPVEKIWISLDPLYEVVRAAADAGVNMIITHHPLIFRPLHTIDLETPIGKIIEILMDAKIALYSAHTNLDSAGQGVNEVLSRTIGLKELTPMLSSEVDDGAHAPMTGLGRIGNVAKGMTLEKYAAYVKKQLKLDYVRIAGDLRMQIRQVAVCSGSGSSLLDDFFRTSAQVYVSGDLRYHDARRVEDESRALIDIGHFPSEVLILKPLADQLQSAAKANGWQVLIEPCELEKDPFMVC